MRTVNPTVLKVCPRLFVYEALLTCLSASETGVEDPLRPASETFTEEDVLDSMWLHFVIVILRLR